MQEVFEPIKNYEGLYSVSNFGRIRSEAKKWISGKGGVLGKDTTFLKPFPNRSGYLYVIFSKNGMRKKYYIHPLIWDHFGNRKRNGRKLQIDHIDNNKLNNRIDNLQLLTPRENISKGHIQNGKKVGKYIGVSWHKRNKKWQARIWIKDMPKCLGYFKNEYDAHLIYQKALKEVYNGKSD